jgi:hypothetical protein
MPKIATVVALIREEMALARMRKLRVMGNLRLCNLRSPRIADNGLKYIANTPVGLWTSFHVKRSS